MDDLIAWLRRQLDDDERVARAATAGPWWHNPGKVWLDAEAFEAYDRTKGEEFVGYGESPFSGCVAATGPGSHAQSMADAAHIARWDPARVLALTAALRDIIDRFSWEAQETRAILALAEALYADRPGYLEEWRPSTG